MRQFLLILLFLAVLQSIHAQPTHIYTDAEKRYKEAKEYIARGDYAFAYPLVRDLRQETRQDNNSLPAYMREDAEYFYILASLQLVQETAKEDAINYIAGVNNEPRRQLVSYHLAHYFFIREDYSHALEYFNRAGFENLSNEQIADAKFEKAYSLFNLKQFAEARPLFNEIHQLPDNKYYLPANYYYGFISYYDKQYAEALSAFRLVENDPAYRDVVPYYITEIYYFQGKKDEALAYGQKILTDGPAQFYDKQLRLLTGQIYFERKDYERALPLLEAYVNSTEKVSKEVLYELSYSNYKMKKYAPAIEGFRQLSNERDSMGQNSMYILGDLYLRTNDKANARNAFQYSAYNSSNKEQQRVSRFHYAKLSYELGYQNIALTEMKNYIRDYPNSNYDLEAKEILVNLLAKTNNFQDALALYQSFDNPTASMQKVFPRILYGRAIEYINDQQLLAADQLLSQVLTNNLSGNLLPYANFWKGEIAYRQAKYDDAIRYLQTYIQSGAGAQGEANPATARYDLGYSFLQKENYGQAYTYFNQVANGVSATSSQVEQDAYLRAADASFMLKDYGRAASMYDRIVNSGLPQADYATYQKAMIAGIKNPGEKIRLLNGLVKQYPSSTMNYEVQLEIALTYIADEKFMEAVPYLQQVIAAPGARAGGLKPAAYVNLGLAYYNANRNAEALRTYQDLLRLYPQSPEAGEAMTTIRDIYVEEGKPDEYVELLRKNGRSISISEADSLTYTAASLKFDAGDCASAITGYTNYIAKYPSGAYIIPALFNRSACYQKNKDFANAFTGYADVSARGISSYYENATLEAARIQYFELKNYAEALKYFRLLHDNANAQENKLEALRGLVRSLYMQKDYAGANTYASELLAVKTISTDDKSVASLVLGKSLQLAGDCAGAINAFKSVAAINKSAWGAEARYEIAACHLTQNNTSAAEKAAMAVIKETGSYDLWVTKSYILLGDIFMIQKDYFNAKATYESVAKNAAIAELRQEAQKKFDQAVLAEKQQSKIGN